MEWPIDIEAGAKDILVEKGGSSSLRRSAEFESTGDPSNARSQGLSTGIVIATAGTARRTNDQQKRGTRGRSRRAVA